MTAVLSALPYDRTRHAPFPPFSTHRELQEFIVVDLFCGLGGASQGMLRALERLGLTEDQLRSHGWRLKHVAINHWQVAIDTIGRNITFAELYNESIENVDPVLTLRGKRPHLLIAACECIMHSSARGNRPIKDQSRTTAAHILKWVDTNPYCLYFENVPEWRDWSVLDEHMRPIKERKGEYYQGFLEALRARGYDIAESIVDCSRYGDGTSRRRLFILGRKSNDGFPRLTIPAPTHTRNVFKEPQLQPCRVARDIIDWNRKGVPITHRTRGPHAPATIRRIQAGYAKKPALLQPILLELLRRLLPIAQEFHNRLNARPSATTLGRKLTKEEKQHNDFILRESRAFARDAIKHAYKRPLGRIRSADITTEQNEAFAIILGQQAGATARTPQEPLPTIAQRGAIGLATVAHGMLVKANASEKSTFDDATQSLDEPMRTIVTKDCRALAQPAVGVVNSLVINATVSEKSTRFKNSARTVDDPISTIVAVDRHGLAEPILANVQHGAHDLRTPDLDAPLLTITQKNSTGIAEPIIAPLYGSNVASGSVDSIHDPLSTVSAQGNHHALAQPVIATIHGLKSDNDNRCRSVDQPLGTLAAGGKQHALIEPVVVARNNPRHGESRIHSLSDPFPTATGSGAGYLAEPVVTSNHFANGGSAINAPLPTATSAAGGGLGLAEPTLCTDVSLLPKNGPFFLFDDQPIAINILYRMLHSSELARAHSLGNLQLEHASEADIVKMIGNSIPAETAAAMIGSVLYPVLGRLEGLMQRAAA